MLPKAEGFPLTGKGGNLAVAGRLLTLGLALVTSLGAIGCVGLTGAPPGGGTGGGSGTPSSSQASQLSPSSSGVDFGNVTVNSSTSQLVTLTVAGTENITISGVTVSGTGFSVSGPSNMTLAPNQSVTISVGFSPKTAGGVTGMLLVSSNATNSSLPIDLSGDGVAASGTHTVSLSWQASTSPVMGYFVFRGSTTSNLSQLNTSAVTSTSYADRTVANGQTYVYAVKSADASNVLSSFSNTVTVTVPSQ
jgi:hypothetical protein